MIRGTVEYYRHVFMDGGIHELISEITSVMKEAGNPVTPERLDLFIKAVLYGYNFDGTGRSRPCQPDMFDLGRGREGQDKYKWDSLVYGLYVKQRNRGVVDG